MNIYRPLKPYNGIGWDKVVGDVCPSISFGRAANLVSTPSNNKTVWDKVIADAYTPNDTDLAQLSNGDAKVLIPGKYLITLKHAITTSGAAVATIQEQLKVVRSGSETAVQTWITGGGPINNSLATHFGEIVDLLANDVVRAYVWIGVNSGSVSSYQLSSSRLTLTRIGE